MFWKDLSTQPKFPVASYIRIAEYPKHPKNHNQDGVVYESSEKNIRPIKTWPMIKRAQCLRATQTTLEFQHDAIKSSINCTAHSQSSTRVLDFKSHYTPLYSKPYGYTEQNINQQREPRLYPKTLCKRSEGKPGKTKSKELNLKRLVN